MAIRFSPDPYQRKQKRHTRTHGKTRNKPEPKIFTDTWENPEPGTMLSYYIVKAVKPVKLGAMAKKLGCLFKFRVNIYHLKPIVIDYFIVSLEHEADVSLIEQYTFKALGKLP